MLTQQRRKLMLQRLSAEGRIVAKTLAAELAVSEDTIRRDLRELAAAGSLQRVHGGALPRAAADADLAARRDIASASKRAIAAAAAKLIDNDQVVIFDGGTTSLALARQLPEDLRITAVTHSPTLAAELARYRAIDIIMIGGKLFKHSMVNVGAAAVEAISHVRADCFFMGVTGVDAEAGLSTGDLEEAYIKRALSRSAAETVVLASTEKLGVASRYKIMPLEEATGLVIEKSAPPALLKALRGKDVEMIRA